MAETHQAGLIIRKPYEKSPAPEVSPPTLKAVRAFQALYIISQQPSGQGEQLRTGWLLGGPDPDSRRVMALGAAQRNIAAALVVAGQSFSDPRVVVMVIVVAIAGFIILMPLARALARP